MTLPYVIMAAHAALILTVYSEERQRQHFGQSGAIWIIMIGVALSAFNALIYLLYAQRSVESESTEPFVVKVDLAVILLMLVPVIVWYPI